MGYNDKYPDMSAMYAVQFEYENKLKDKIKELETELIRTRKALDVAVDTLERIASEECKYPIGAAAGTIIRIEQINETKGGKNESR